MHGSSYYVLERFLQTYLESLVRPKVLEVGSRQIKGQSKPRLSNAQWFGVDLEKGEAVTHILTEPYKYPFADGYFDSVIATSVFEHAEFFWKTAEEMVRVCRPGGTVYINAPSNGNIHRFPTDSWRFYPDAGRSLQRWINRNYHLVDLKVSVLLEPSTQGGWSDYVCVFQKVTSSPSAAGATDADTRFRDSLKELVHYDSLNTESPPHFPHPDRLYIEGLKRRIKKLTIKIQELSS